MLDGVMEDWPSSFGCIVRFRMSTSQRLACDSQPFAPILIGVVSLNAYRLRNQNVDPQRCSLLLKSAKSTSVTPVYPEGFGIHRRACPSRPPIARSCFTLCASSFFCLPSSTFPTPPLQHSQNCKNTMALPQSLEHALTPQELTFITEEEHIEIVPSFGMSKIRLVSVSPFLVLLIVGLRRMMD